MIRVICHWVTTHAAGIVRPPTSPNGPHILFTAAQVAARRASWARAAAVMLVCVPIGGASAGPPGAGLPPLPPQHDAPPPLTWLPLPPMLLLPDEGDDHHGGGGHAHHHPGGPGQLHDVPEPPAGAVLAAALAALFILRRTRA